MTSNLQFSAPVRLLSYAAPSITGITGCIPGSSAKRVINCNRDGGDVITINGQDFGAESASILIGEGATVTLVLVHELTAEPCLNITHDIASPHTKLTCILPPGNQVDRPVLGEHLIIGVRDRFAVLQLNGQITPLPGFVSFQQCHPGQKQVNLACVPCESGFFTNADSQISCLPCGA